MGTSRAAARQHQIPLRLGDQFAGCGGLALGFEAQGFRTVGFEMKPVAVQTYNANLDGRCEETFLKVGIPEGKAEIVIGGPPCQPFSQIGYQRGNRDPRDGFPVFLDAVARIAPKIAIIENVRGLLFRNKDYRSAVREFERLGYTVHVNILKAKEYGVPQNRERVVVVASKVGWSWPERMLSAPVDTTFYPTGAKPSKHSTEKCSAKVELHHLTPNVKLFLGGC